MKSRSKSKNRSSAVYVLMLAAALGLGAAGAYVKSNPKAERVPEDLRQQTSTPPPAETRTTEVQAAPKQTFVMRAVPGDTEITLEKSLEPVPEGVNAMAFAVTQTMRAFRLNQVRALDVELKDGKATIFFNPALLETGFGSMQESMLVKAIRATMSQFPDVKGVELSVEGQRVETLGHFDLDNPLLPLKL